VPQCAPLCVLSVVITQQLTKLTGCLYAVPMLRECCGHGEMIQHVESIRHVVSDLKEIAQQVVKYSPSERFGTDDMRCT